MAHSENGNIKNSLSILHWNLGARLWHNKVTEIQALVDEHSPDHCFISEANLQAGLPDYETNIEGYLITTPVSHEVHNMSRIVLLSKLEAQFTVERRRMNSEIASIWIKIGGKGARTTLVCGIYREHTLIHENAMTTLDTSAFKNPDGKISSDSGSTQPR